ncbi:MAG: hypothetical protein ACYS14_08865 [Planctomycetota bacterium]
MVVTMGSMARVTGHGFTTIGVLHPKGWIHSLAFEFVPQFWLLVLPAVWRSNMRTPSGQRNVGTWATAAFRGRGDKKRQLGISSH